MFSIIGIQSGYADENLRAKLEDSKEILDYAISALNYDSYLTKNYVRDDLEFLDKVISNCGKTGMPAKLAEYRTTSIFYGRVLEIADSIKPFEKIVTLDVEKKWYGDIPNPVQIATDIEECGNAFELDKKFLVFTVGNNPLFAPFYYVAPPPGPIPEGPRSATYDVENSIGYMERVYMDSGRLDRLNQLKPQIDHAYNVIKKWEQQNNATTSFGMWFVADDTSGLVKLDKGQMALVVSMGVNSSITKEDLSQLLRDMLGDIPIHLAGQSFFVREGAESESSQILSPLKQIKNGILPEDVICRQDRVLVLRTNGDPACVKYETGYKLLERGWYSNSPLSTQIVYDPVDEPFNLYRESLPLRHPATQYYNESGTIIFPIESNSATYEFAESNLVSNNEFSYDKFVPTYAPAGQELKFIVYKPETGYIHIIYAPNTEELTPDYPTTSVFDKHGIRILVSETGGSKFYQQENVEKIIQGRGPMSVVPTSDGGFAGVGDKQGNEGWFSIIYFGQGEWQFEVMSGRYNADELIRMINSMSGLNIEIDWNQKSEFNGDISIG